MSKGTVGPKAIFKARVAAEPEFFPGYTKADGTKVGHRLVARLYVNPVGRKRENGVRDDLPPMKYTVTAWGNAALDWARNASIGKTIDFLLVDEQQYQSKVYVGDQIALDNNGQPMLTTRSSYTALEWFWGDDSAKTINNDIKDGHRHHGWDGKLEVSLLQQVLAGGGDVAIRHLIEQAGHAREAWLRTVQLRKTATYVPGATRVGRAIVKQTASTPATGGNNSFGGQVNNAVQNQAPAQGQPVYNGYQAPGQPPQPTYNQPHIPGTGQPQAPPANPDYTRPAMPPNQGFQAPPVGAPTGQQGHYFGGSASGGANPGF